MMRSRGMKRGQEGTLGQGGRCEKVDRTFNDNMEQDEVMMNAGTMMIKRNKKRMNKRTNTWT